MDYMSCEQAVDTILEIGRRIYASGMVAANDGNISIKIGDNEILATPTGVSKGYMTKEMLVRVDLDGNQLAGTMKPSSEIKMHLRIYKENENVRSVVHAHPPVATAYAAARVAIDEPVLPEEVIQLGHVPVAEYATPGSQGIPDSIAAFSRDHSAVLLANHGVTTWGKSPYEAYYRMEIVEHTAKILLTAKQIGNGPVLLTASQVQGLIDIRTKIGATFY